MEHFSEVSAVRRWVGSCRDKGETIGFVPTMGALHDGHLALVETAAQRCDRVVVSIFVNPTQFGPGEDFERYPRDIDGDAALLKNAGCRALYQPTVQTIYPSGPGTIVQVPESLENDLCGACRPGHFRGVATVVTILLNQVAPDLAVFGQKDYQQLTVIRRLVRDLHLPVEVVGVETVRESDGLAMSSRNRYLDTRARQQAVGLSRALQAAALLWQSGERQAALLEAEGRRVLTDHGIDRIDYVEVRHAETLERESVLSDAAVMVIAAYVGAARLIDNRVL
ncbi:MAG: pantoate--beta-alanine ligase [Magnetococcales bacterium]|nr:pantoate--beta-alanine ligase [Magnetococcales bacterium]